jgi:hypothetical protein
MHNQVMNSKNKKIPNESVFWIEKSRYSRLRNPNSSDQIQGLITLFFWGIF